MIGGRRLEGGKAFRCKHEHRDDDTSKRDRQPDRVRAVVDDHRELLREKHDRNEGEDEERRVVEQRAARFRLRLLASPAVLAGGPASSATTSAK